MLKILKGLLIVIGVVCVVLAIVLVVKNIIDINQLSAVASANKSNNLYPNPRNQVLIMGGAGLVGGFMLGLGLGMPSQTFKRKNEDRQKQAATQMAQDAGHNGSTPAPRPEA